MSERYVWDLREVDGEHVAFVGGKGAHLGELSRIEGIRVPGGFCVTTAAHRRTLERVPSLAEGIGRLARVDAEDRESLRAVCGEIRRTIEDTPLPEDVAEAITGALAGSGEGVAYAVRSSATAEDLPTASFAGQQDTYLNVLGAEEVLRHVRRCWASLFTERAVVYRRHHGIEDRTVGMAVVVQRMVLPEAAGVLFTADPVSGNRTVATVDAGFGLGEALVSGTVTPDVFTVRGEEILARSVGAKQRAVQAVPGGGTRTVEVEPRRQREPALSDARVRELVALGRRIEAHFGRPQDIEWCLTGDGFAFVQSRPITTLFPLPENPAGGNHVYLSVGHQQMMTDPMKALGLSVWQLMAMAPMLEAGGRLFVDAAPRLASPARAVFLDMIGRSDPVTRDALETVLARKDFLPAPPDEVPPGPPAGAAPPPPLEADPALVAELIDHSRTSLAALRRDLADRSGPELFDFLLGPAAQEHKRVLSHPPSLRVITAGMEAAWWLNDKLEEWLGEKNAADTLTLSAPGNITSEMGLALLDVADVVRPYPEVVAFLRNVEHGKHDERGDFLDRLADLPGGAHARDALRDYLDRYGMRCAGEIDLTRERWSERPGTLLPVLLDHVRNAEPGAAERRFEEGRQEARHKEREVLERLRALPDGERKAAEAKAMIDRVRAFAGYREYPKYDIVNRFFLYKQALLAEADRLVTAGALTDREDVFHLTLREFREAVRTGRVDEGLVRRRKEEFRFFGTLTPPRVLTSDGESVTGSYRREGVPEGALVGLPVSTGTVEGRARVVRDMAEAELEAGDILVTAFTDPSWSPVFLGIAALVTEVGGLMTHGAVIAREYGLPAVVGVDGATRLIRDGQRIRVHGGEGYVELLP
ncbi:rifamycin-inactivating phosphotransferase [Streptomyces griseoaurantiacus]|uniref:rifamycin-inactivating phosphotransferase n=1 Tax=Streptomyces griseoaurantiacus TaxID=68213 RepID=UPI0037B3E69F